MKYLFLSITAALILINHAQATVQPTEYQYFDNEVFVQDGPEVRYDFGSTVNYYTDRYLAVGNGYYSGGNGTILFYDTTQPINRDNYVFIIQNPRNHPLATLELFGHDVRQLAGSDKIVITAPRGNAVHIFDSPANGHSLLHTFAETTGYEYGMAIANRHNLMIIGAPGTFHGEGKTSGSVFIYNSDYSSPDFGQKILEIKNPSDTIYGFGVSMTWTSSHQLAIASHPQAFPLIYGDEGTVFIYDMDITNPTFGQIVHEFKNPSNEKDNYFGRNVVAIGNHLFVSAAFDDIAGEDRGAVYVFDAGIGSATFGKLITTIIPPPSAPAYFGASLTAFQDHILVGSRDSNFYLFDANTSRDSYGRLTDYFIAPTEGSNYGPIKSVAVNGNQIAFSHSDYNGGLIDKGNNIFTYNFDATPQDPSRFPTLEDKNNDSVIDIGDAALTRYELYLVPGNANGDMAVDLDDFNILKAYMGRENVNYLYGDFSGDKQVGLQDFAILKSNFGQVIESSSIAQKADQSALLDFIHQKNRIQSQLSSSSIEGPYLEVPTALPSDQISH